MKAKAYKLITSLPFIGKKIAASRQQRQLKLYRKKLHDIPPVFIYQQGKVGSSTLRRSIRKYYDGAVMAAHNIENGFDWTVDVLNEEVKKQPIPIKIITPIREPISRNLSAFFQNFERFAGVKFEDSRHSVQELMDIFFEKVGHEFPINFLDLHIYKHFGIDAYETPFPNEDYVFLKKGDVELLIMKYDIDETVKNKIIGDLINNKSFKIDENRNVSSSKKYASVYKEIQNISLPKWYIDKMLNNKYMRHFYSKEIKGIADKWS